MLQRFNRWVSSVENEPQGEEAARGFRATVSRGMRKVFLTIGRFFHRLFSIKPIPEDHRSGIYQNISARGIPTKNYFLWAFFLAIPTLMIYPLHTIEVVSQSVNIACRKDGKRTWGVLPFLVFSVITLGIFPLVWHCKVINRMNDYCEKHGIECRISKRFYLCWTLIGFPILIGPLVALARFLSVFRDIARNFNATHSFPLADEVLAVEIPEQPEEQRPRKSIIEQILAPDEALPTEEQSAEDDEDDDDEDDDPILN
jgi:hypothetical protein